ncbi:MAG: hypothetical protein JNL32_16300 [Candidatus Kapabacteria bacterium]|nr:hypothetical protein [Candidatus Kapabacteria bacterium]
MKLIDFMDYLTSPELLGDLYNEMGISIQPDELLIYVRDYLDIHSDIFFFSLDETNDQRTFEKDGVKYDQIFSVDYAVNLISMLDLRDKDYTNEYIAQRLIEYCINDA